MRRLQHGPVGHWRSPRLLLRAQEATPGHYAVAQIVQEAAYACDPSAETEVPGLLPGTELRPADVLAAALGNALTALDVSICSPRAQEAGLDCTQTMVDSKLGHCGPHLKTLRSHCLDFLWQTPTPTR